MKQSSRLICLASRLPSIGSASARMPCEFMSGGIGWPRYFSKIMPIARRASGQAAALSGA